MSRFCTLCSSSSGNSTYIGHAKGSILIDAGTNAKKLTASLEQYSIEPDSIGGIFLTHEHTDHTGALRVFAARYGITVYATEGTLSALEKNGCVNGKFNTCVIPENGIEVSGMFIRKFRTSHDSAESCGYTVDMPDERKISVVTDTGIITEDTLEKVTGSDLILLESNHDIDMLQNGAYPYYLKQRIMSPVGHLSNDECAKAARHFVNTGTTRLVLGHLSKENNTPRSAFDTTNTALGEMGALPGEDYVLQVAPADEGGRMVVL